MILKVLGAVRQALTQPRQGPTMQHKVSLSPAAARDTHRHQLLPASPHKPASPECHTELQALQSGNTSSIKMDDINKGNTSRIWSVENFNIVMPDTETVNPNTNCKTFMCILACFVIVALTIGLVVTAYKSDNRVIQTGAFAGQTTLVSSSTTEELSTSPDLVTHTPEVPTTNDSDRDTDTGSNLDDISTTSDPSQQTGSDTTYSVLNTQLYVDLLVSHDSTVKKMTK